jgi:hypothetical protein
MKNHHHPTVLPLLYTLAGPFVLVGTCVKKPVQVHTCPVGHPVGVTFTQGLHTKTAFVKVVSKTTFQKLQKANRK